ncbi:unnamed protein product [Rangifer tarandus platyrhynchus]|uniref:Uncharacterized protein n=1 Tax=Rangifer tarandus platyrhynchus TaxID=3082113 RepID=A0ABN8YF16_RANTA|nr:unnamed protein product [Rangifer tarandus platyrhynchus]
MQSKQGRVLSSRARTQELVFVELDEEEVVDSSENGVRALVLPLADCVLLQANALGPGFLICRKRPRISGH